MKTTKIQIISNNHKYPIIIGSNISRNFTKILRDNLIDFNKCLVVIDKKVPKKLYKKILQSLKKKTKIIFFFKAKESNKNYTNVNKILEKLLKNNFNRNDCLISVGGGITGDVSGFAASIFKRGIKFINIPTTLLAQVDSSIGGKTGINSKEGKNLVGSFYQPNLVLSDSNFLKTLPKREIVCGYAEILKHAIISSKKNFLFLNKNALKILKLKSPFIERSIYQSCLIKKNIVQKDEKEKNLRKVLNFGHTFAHAYEASLKYSSTLNHGEAVLLGIMHASKFSFLNKLLNKNDFELIKNHLINFKLIKKLNNSFFQKNVRNILNFMKKDKKNTSKKINLVLLKKIGKPIFNLDYSENKIKSFIKDKLVD
tara:strand:- start:686 stop:1792 length:1107 start_codon:yes stop_codon:yes gene_type:complete